MAEYVDLDATYRTGTPAAARPVAATRALGPRREAITKANGVITRHAAVQQWAGPDLYVRCTCGWPDNGLPYAPSYEAHVAERLWENGCLA
jgi:hypothetical protein